MLCAACLAAALLAQPAPPAPPDAAASADAPAPPARPEPTAVERLRQQAEANPEDPTAWARLGAQLLREDRPADALAPLERALALDPDATDPGYNYAYALRATGRNDDAAGAYRRYLERVPGDADAWFALAQTEEARGAWLPAAEAYTRYAAVEGRPGQARWVEQAREKAAALRARAAPPAAAAADGGPEDAEATTTQPSPPLRLPALQAALRELEAGDYAAARARLQREVPEPADGFAWAAYGSAHLGLGEWREAERAFAEAARQLRGRARAGALLGQAEALRALGRDAAAAEVYAEVAEIEGPDEPWGAVAARRLDR